MMMTAATTTRTTTTATTTTTSMTFLITSTPPYYYYHQVVERPQYMLMRVALGIHGEDLPAVLETYTLMSEKWFIHASPTLFHSGTK